MPNPSIPLILLLLPALVLSQCCLQTDDSAQYCLVCPKGTHLYRDNCIFDIPSCLSYSEGFSCEKCAEGYSLVDSLRGNYSSRRCQQIKDSIQAQAVPGNQSKIEQSNTTVNPTPTHGSDKNLTVLEARNQTLSNKTTLETKDSE